MNDKSTEFVVVGASLAGLAAALALAHAGRDVTLIGPAPDAADTRTAALLQATVSALDNMGVTIAGNEAAAPLRIMRIVDATSRLIRARPMVFEAGEIGLDAFGWNIANGALIRLLDSAVSATGKVRRLPVPATGWRTAPAGVTVEMADGSEVSARLAVAADGRNSLLRQAAGIDVTTRTYPQTAMAVNLAVSRPHDDTSTELHTEHGPFTLVPLPGQRVGLVWVMDSEAARDVAELDDDALALRIEQVSHSLLGAVRIDGARSFWPLAHQAARRLTAPGLILVGEAAHALPPIGAQGFNLTVADVSALAAIISAADGGDDAGVLQRYERTRQPEVSMRGAAVDMLNRTLLSDALLAQGMRGVGGYALEQIGPLRRLVMRYGVAGATRT